MRITNKLFISMKKILFLILLVVFAGCYTPRPGYIDYRERRMMDWDPIYYVPGFPDPFFYQYRQPRIIYRYVPVPNTPQQPRIYNNKPNVPPPGPRGGSAPIRTFPRKEDNKEK